MATNGLITIRHYTKTARALHWVMALPIVALLVLGQQTMGSHTARWLPSLHASTGLVVVLMFAVRVIWRWKHPPAISNYRSGWEVIASHTVHSLLYGGMVLIPISGWLAYTEHVHRSMGIRPASWFGFRIPLLPDFGFNWHIVHNWSGKLMMVLIAVHVAAALKHHLFDQDETLKRMLPW